MVHTFRKSKDCRQHALVTYAKSALKVGSLLVTVRVLKMQRPDPRSFSKSDKVSLAMVLDTMTLLELMI